MRAIWITLIGLVLVGCTTTETRLASSANIRPASAASRVLVVQPDVQLAELTAAGLSAPRADWGQAGRDNLNRDLQAAIVARGRTIGQLDPDILQAGRTGQLIRLHDLVGQSILAFSYGDIRLPTKTGPLDWTLGEGAATLARSGDADYALFVTANGTYASTGRKMLTVGAALLGVDVPLGRQQVFASLVDLKTGRIVWFNLAVAGPSADMRETDGSRQLVKALLKDAPF